MNAKDAGWMKVSVFVTPRGKKIGGRRGGEGSLKEKNNDRHCILGRVQLLLLLVEVS